MQNSYQLQLKEISEEVEHLEYLEEWADHLEYYINILSLLSGITSTIILLFSGTLWILRPTWRSFKKYSALNMAMSSTAVFLLDLWLPFFEEHEPDVIYKRIVLVEVTHMFVIAFEYWLLLFYLNFCSNLIKESRIDLTRKLSACNVVVWGSSIVLSSLKLSYKLHKGIVDREYNEYIKDYSDLLEFKDLMADIVLLLFLVASYSNIVYKVAIKLSYNNNCLGLINSGMFLAVSVIVLSSSIVNVSLTCWQCWLVYLRPESNVTESLSNVLAHCVFLMYLLQVTIVNTLFVILE